MGEALGKKITTIEGLPAEHPVKRAWILEQVPQCGYCQPGQIMQAAALLMEDPNPTDGKDPECHGRRSLPVRDLSPDPEGHQEGS